MQAIMAKFHFSSSLTGLRSHVDANMLCPDVLGGRQGENKIQVAALLLLLPTVYIRCE